VHLRFEIEPQLGLVGQHVIHAANGLDGRHRVRGL
jgi:hypothetical protein